MGYRNDFKHLGKHLFVNIVEKASGLERRCWQEHLMGEQGIGISSVGKKQEFSKWLAWEKAEDTRRLKGQELKKESVPSMALS